MARARNIKPSFFKNEDLVELPFEARLLFAGLWTLADREGRLEDRPKRIKMEIFPADEVDVVEMLDALEGRGFIRRYLVEGMRCIHVCAWDKHQTPHHTERASTLPSPPYNGDLTVKDASEDSGNPSDSLIPDSLIPEEAPPPVAPAPSKAARKTSIPANFGVSERVREWAKKNGHHSLDKHLEHFVGSCKARGAKYLDWDEALMTAIRANWAKVPIQQPAQQHPVVYEPVITAEWWKTNSGIEAKARELGIDQGADQWPVFKHRVLEAAKARENMQ
jgi:hypothetical protein